MEKWRNQTHLLVDKLLFPPHFLGFDLEANQTAKDQTGGLHKEA